MHVVFSRCFLTHTSIVHNIYKGLFRAKLSLEAIFNMCGIIGYVGSKNAAPILIEGLKRLEYRGYDSAGISTICIKGCEECAYKENCVHNDSAGISKNNSRSIIVEKDIGKINEVEAKVNFSNLKGFIGLGHCRWSTHGGVTKENAHPHTDCSGNISIVHNGIIENFSELKEKLITKGHKFKSATDTEVIAHLIEDSYDGSIEAATRKALKQVEGSYALGIICAKEPDVLIAAI